MDNGEFGQQARRMHRDGYAQGVRERRTNDDAVELQERVSKAQSKAAERLDVKAYKRLGEAASMLSEEAERMAEAEEKESLTESEDAADPDLVPVEDSNPRKLGKELEEFFEEEAEEKEHAEDDWTPEAREAAAKARKNKPKTDLERERENMTPKEKAAARRSDREKQGVAWKKEQERVMQKHMGYGDQHSGNY